VLDGDGHTVVEAVDGVEAVRTARELLPELILMDWQMPVMDGLEATQVLKADPATRHIPIIIVTAYAMTGDRERAFAAGCDEYIAKPVDAVHLCETVVRIARR
jgi:two-component system cell cycle response regulator DivK